MSESRRLFYRMRELVDITSLSRHTILRMIKQGDFPKPLKVGDRAIAFDVNEIDGWLQAKKEAR